MSQNIDTTGSRLWIVLGIVGCLAGGAAATWLLSNSRKAELDMAQGRTPIAGVARGQRIVAPRDHTASEFHPGGADNAGGLKDGSSPAVTFDMLSGFYYEVGAADRPNDQIPATVRAFDGKKVAVQGFMIPITLERGATKEFLIARDRICCPYGANVPRMNEWISVKMSDNRTTRYIADQPVTISGTLHVGEEIVNGEVMSVYRMDADDLAGPLDP